ncbi:hypothetical protein [Streptomyces sp. NBC_00101]|uniref:hypothetical protein n=1 Tax=Streptomyces sp. NBC_00101 TaxID=2975651 RepID=UPI003863B68B
MSTSPNTSPSTPQDTPEAAVGQPAFVRLQVELVVEITDPGALTGAALEAVAAEYEEATPDPDDDGTDHERRHAESLVRADAAEALASLIDPLDLVGALPGIELAEASWSSEVVEPDDAADERRRDGDDPTDYTDHSEYAGKGPEDA